MNDVDIILAGILAGMDLRKGPTSYDAKRVAEEVFMYLKAIREEQAKND